MSVAISVLAYGLEHIIELNDLITRIQKNTIFIYTDTKNLDYPNNVVVIKGEEPFNYNLKRKAIEAAFLENNTIVMMDTDIILNYEYEFDSLDLIEDGLYVNWYGAVQNYKGKKISITQVLNGKSGINEIDMYGESLVNCGATIDNITFFDEFIFVLKISDKVKKTQFLNTWQKLDNQTRLSQPKDRHKNELNGALESLIISLSCNIIGIEIFNNSNEVKRLFEAIAHYGSIKHLKNLI